MKVMISQPMQGLSEEEIQTQFEKIKQMIEGYGGTVVDVYFKEDWDKADMPNKPLYFLGETIKKMSECDAVYFADDWFRSRGCSILYYIALKYGLKTLFKGSLELENLNG